MMMAKSLLRAYRKCLRNKSHIRQTAFHMHHETWIMRLAAEIIQGRYQPRPATIFVVTRPKPREVIAAHIQDRIVHHFIYDHMLDFWERRFDSRSYACRPGKGALAASMDLRDFVRGFQAHNAAPLWYLKVDVQAFFPSIDRVILAGIILPKLKNPLIRDIVTTILKHDPVAPGHYRIASSKRLMALVPKHKSLFTVPHGKGLPIGNLTSQFFANIYMNEVDQFLARRANPRPLYWQRYVDDIVCMDTDPQRLSHLSCVINQFLGAHLGLVLHPKKTIIQPLSRGLDHLGYFHLPNRVYPRKRVLKAAKNKLHQTILGPDQSADEILPWANSYLGHFGHADSHRLRQNFCQTLSQHYLRHEMSITGDFRSIKNLRAQRERRHIASRSIIDDVLMDDSLLVETLLDDL